jgi:hypothetical protein
VSGFRYERTTDEDLATRASVSLEAVQLLRSSEVVDLHIESFIPPRLWGYDLLERHGTLALGGRFFGHLDFPRSEQYMLDEGWSPGRIQKILGGNFLRTFRTLRPT